MGGAAKPVRQAGRWFDKNVAQSKWAGAAAPFLTLPYQAMAGKGWFAPAGTPATPELASMQQPTYGDAAVQAARKAQLAALKAGGRRASFLGDTISGS